MAREAEGGGRERREGVSEVCMENEVEEEEGRGWDGIVRE